MPIRPKVFISLLVTALIPLVILGVFTYTASSDGLRAELLGKVQTFASVQAHRIADLISHEKAELALIASRTRLRTLLARMDVGRGDETEAAEMDRILTDAQRSLQSFLSISVADPDGTVLASSEPALKGTSIAERDAFKKALGGEYIHDFVRSAAGQLSEVALLGPMEIDDGMIGVAMVVIDTAVFTSTLNTDPTSGADNETSLVEVQPGGTLELLVSADGNTTFLDVFAAGGGEAITMSENWSHLDAENAEGEELIAAIRAIPGSDLAVVVAVPKEDALNSIQKMRGTSMLILGSAFAFAAMVAFGLARSISDPIRKLAHTADRVARENVYDEADEFASGEIGALAQSFNRMTGRLLRANRKLEQTVAQRTGELESAQMLLIHSEKMESLGRLAAGVAHEVKNPLAIIQMGVDYIKSNFNSGDKNLAKLVKGMEEAIAKADSIIHGLLDLTRSDGIVRVISDANSVVEKALELAGYELKREKIKIVRNLGEGLPEVRLDRGKMEQVFINIISNAAHAMPDGGTFYVSTSHLILEEAERNPGVRHFDRLRSNDGVIVFEFRDTGPGIPDDKLQKIFEPFYTTKPPGEGTGLGLGIAKTIVELHHGELQIDNHPDGGARVRILIKISDGGSTAFRTPPSGEKK